MDLTKINISVLREMLKLSERKEELLKELKELEEKIISHASDFNSATPSKFKKPKKIGVHATQKINSSEKISKRASRGTMKVIVLDALKEAGPAGIKIPELAHKIGVKNANLHVWFSNTGKKLPEIERIGVGLFRVRQSVLEHL
ncbi:MAG: hypothetical protein K9M81_06195 [Chthoniobacterales bacterium]|nr:hypothetical protein [Chthoniobacterales bacterium]